MITTASTLANQLPIPGGIISRGYYLKKKYDFSYSRFTSSTIALFFCYVSVNGFIGLAIILYWLLINHIVTALVLLIVYLLMASVIFIFWLPVNKFHLPKKVMAITQQVTEGWTFLGKNPGKLIQLFMLQFSMTILLGFRYWITFHMVSQNISISQSFLFASGSILTQLVSLAPGGLGVREAIVASIGSALGFDASVSVLAVGLDRLIITVIIFLSGWVSTMILSKQISKDKIE